MLRRDTIQSLAVSLITTCANKRIENAAVSHFTGISFEIMECFRRLGFIIPTVARRRSSSLGSTRKRCFHIECKTAKPAKNQNKCSKVCQTCEETFCENHLEIITTIICANCVLD